MGKTTRTWKVLALARKSGWQVEEEMGGYLLIKDQTEIQVPYGYFDEIDAEFTEYYRGELNLNSEDL
jgi:hypothetical protein